MEIILSAALILLAILCSFLFLYYWGWNKKSAMTYWPVVGMLPGLLHNASHIHEYITQVLKQSGGTFEYKGPWLANMDLVITSDLANVQYILIKNFKNFEKGDAFKSIFFDALGDGIFISESDSWKVQRKLAQSLIKHSKFQRLLEKTIWQKVEKGLFPVLEQAVELGKEVDLKEVFQRFTFDYNVIFMFGFDPCCLSVEFPEVLYAKAFDEIEEVMLYRHIVPEWYWKLQKWLQIGEEKKLRKARETLDKFLAHHISLKRELRKRNKIQKEKVYDNDDEDGGFDLLTAYMEEEEKEEENEKAHMGAVTISDNFLRDTTFNLMAAGRDSVSAGLTWFFWLIAMNPAVEIKILEEIKEKFHINKYDENWRAFSAQELSRLVHLHAALCESLRLYPPAPINHKATVQPDILPSGLRVDRNTKILFSVYSMGRMEEIWGDDCFEFKPERWISERGEIIHVPSYKFATFNAGPRTCLGVEMTFILMKIVAVAIICKYQIQVVEGHLISPSNSIILHMEDGLKVRFTKR